MSTKDELEEIGRQEAEENCDNGQYWVSWEHLEKAYVKDLFAIVDGMTVGAGTIGGEPCESCSKIYRKYKAKLDKMK